MRDTKGLTCRKCGEGGTAEMDGDEDGWWFIDDSDAECDNCGGEMEVLPDSEAFEETW